MDPHRPIPGAGFIIGVLLSGALWAALVVLWAWFSYA